VRHASSIPDPNGAQLTVRVATSSGASSPPLQSDQAQHSCAERRPQPTRARGDRRLGIVAATARTSSFTSAEVRPSRCTRTCRSALRPSARRPSLWRAVL